MRESGYRLCMFASFVRLTRSAGSITRNQVYVSWYAYFQAVTYDLDVMQASPRPQDHCHAQPLFPASSSHVETYAILRVEVRFPDVTLHPTSSISFFPFLFPYCIILSNDLIGYPISMSIPFFLRWFPYGSLLSRFYLFSVTSCLWHNRTSWIVLRYCHSIWYFVFIKHRVVIYRVKNLTFILFQLRIRIS